MANWFDKIFRRNKQTEKKISWMRSIASGSMYKVSDLRGNTGLSEIRTKIDVMRALARDSQINTALSYYATDATTTNTSGQIIWATATSESDDDTAAKVINTLFKKWKLNSYVRDHILELATVGNLYLPTTLMYREEANQYMQKGVVLDNNTIPDYEYEIVPSTKIPPEDIVHLWYQGQPQGYILNPDDSKQIAMLMPEDACIHFSLGGLLGEYVLPAKDKNGDDVEYDIQFAEPLMSQAVQPTQTLSLLEDAVVLSSLSRTIKFLNVECGKEEDEIRDALQQIKDAVEQQLALNTASGDVQSFVNPQSPNNLIYLPKINGQDALSVTDLNMAEASDTDNKLLQYYQDKKLSVLGVPKEAMNFSSNEGLGGAGSVLSQRSALYANILQRLETAYMEGWTDAFNKYFINRNLSGYVDKFTLHMNPIITVQSTVQFEKRDAAIGQATTLVDLLKSVGITKREIYQNSLVEILTEVFPQMGADAKQWPVDVQEGADDGGF